MVRHLRDVGMMFLDPPCQGRYGPVLAWEDPFGKKGDPFSRSD